MPQANTKLPYDKTDKYAIWEYSKQLLGPDFEEAGMELKCTPLKEMGAIQAAQTF